MIRSPDEHGGESGPRLALATTVAVVAASLLTAVGTVPLTAVGAGGPTSSRQATDRPCDPTPQEPSSATRPARVMARRVATADQPVDLALAPDGGGSGVLAERAGRLLRVELGRLTSQVVVDLTADTSGEGDGGLLGVAYQPDGRWLYVYRTTARKDDEITAYPVDARGRADVERGRVILHVPRTPSKQHHGGSVAFGPDGMLYVGLGDGGGLGDPMENAQDPSTLLGKVLRIEPTPSARRPYRVPSDNPFVGLHGWSPEIWALGVRNPFRMSIDAATGDMWLGDVGQSCHEEIDQLSTGSGAGGANLGWDRYEGHSVFEGGTLRGREVRPVHTYSHDGGRCAIVTGPVLRGDALPQLDGWLLFTDYCGGRLHGLQTTNPSPDGSLIAVDLGLRFERPVAIVAGPFGLPWVLGLDGVIYELAGF
ncbi:MAG: PQQ-dependent sugar dehydrogenase [Actinomycetota bacterium]